MFTLILFLVHLWQRTVELVDGVHHVQQHVVANNEFPLHVRRKKWNNDKIFKQCQWRGEEHTDWEMAWMTLEKPTASFISSCSEQMQSEQQLEALQHERIQSFGPRTCSRSSFCCSRLFLSSSSTLLTWINRSFCAHTHTHTQQLHKLHLCNDRGYICRNAGFYFLGFDGFHVKSLWKPGPGETYQKL